MTEEYHPETNGETWPGEGRQDLEGFDDGDTFGRIYLDNTTQERTADGAGTPCVYLGEAHNCATTGLAESARGASRLAEEHYEKLEERNGR